MGNLRVLQQIGLYMIVTLPDIFRNGYIDQVLRVVAQIFAPHILQLPVERYSGDDQNNRYRELRNNKNFSKEGASGSLANFPINYCCGLKGGNKQCRVASGYGACDDGHYQK